MDSDHVMAMKALGRLRGARIVEVRVGPVAYIQLSRPDGLLALGGRFSITRERAPSVAVDVERDPVSASPMLQLVGAEVVQVELESGSLAVVIEGEVRIVVPVDHRYESWTWHGSDGSAVVCMPGGELAVWGS